MILNQSKHSHAVSKTYKLISDVESTQFHVVHCLFGTKFPHHIEENIDKPQDKNRTIDRTKKQKTFLFLS